MNSFLCLFTIFTFVKIFLGSANAGVTCGLDGVCRDSDKDGEGTVCGNCKSCTFKNCCNQVYTSQLAECKIPGWRADNYVGNVPVDIGAPKKRSAGCSDSNPCADEKAKCVAYKKGDSTGFCWKGPQGEGGDSLLALAIAIAALVIIL